MPEYASATLPYPLLIPLTLVFLAIHVHVWLRTPSLIARFLITVLWLRFMMGAFHPITIPPLVGGFSINSLVSIAVFLLGLALVDKRYFALKPLLAVYLLMAVLIGSALLNAAYTPALSHLVKWGYFLVVLTAFMEALERLGPDKLFPRLLTCFIPPIALQIISVVIGVAKPIDRYGQIVYIGGYAHEAAFSIVILSCLFLLVVAPTIRPRLRIGLVFLAVSSIILASYRTTFIAAAPILAGFFVIYPLQIARGAQRSLILVSVLWLSLIAAWVAIWFLHERFSDISDLASAPSILVQEPSSFNIDERRLLSARVYIWSQYIHGYLQGTDWQLILGFGPDAWIGIFNVYAHNTVLSYLYEFGFLGVIAVIGLWSAMMLPVRRIQDRSLGLEILFSHLGFIFLSMATMPYWLIEGLILYALICGSTLHLAYRREIPGPASAPLERPLSAPPLSTSR